MLIPVLIVSSLVHIYSIGYMSSDPWCRAKGKHVPLIRGGGDKLPNSGESLKPLIPKYNRKIYSGWTNYSGMVTSQRMTLRLVKLINKQSLRGGWKTKLGFFVEREMGNRGSKSMVYKYTVVKEQRVDGNWPVLSGLRYTLKGLERDRTSMFNCNGWIHRSYNTYTKIPSNQFDYKKYSTFPLKLHNINPDTWSGLIDGEGSFSIIVSKNEKRKLGWRTELKFQIGLHIKDINILYLLQEYMQGLGSINKSNHRDIVNYSINSIEGWSLLISHLDKYPLRTQKRADYLLFKKAFEIVKDKSHLTKEGLSKIINIKASMNLGLSDVMKSEFPQCIPVKRPEIKVRDLELSAHWLSGFISAEGNFDIRIPSTTSKLGYRVQLRFRITQHNRDIELMEEIVRFLKCGKIYNYGSKSAVSLSIVDFTHITNNLLPYLEKYPIMGVKYYDYLDWLKIHSLMYNRHHLTVEGIESIRKIKSGMNRGRIFEE